MAGAFLAHVGDPSDPLSWYPLAGSVLIAVLIGVVLRRLLAGPLGATTPRRLATLAVLVAAGALVLIAGGRVILH